MQANCCTYCCYVELCLSSGGAVAWDMTIVMWNLERLGACESAFTRLPRLGSALLRLYESFLEKNATTKQIGSTAAYVGRAYCSASGTVLRESPTSPCSVVPVLHVSGSMYYHPPNPAAPGLGCNLWLMLQSSRFSSVLVSQAPERDNASMRCTTGA